MKLPERFLDSTQGFHVLSGIHLNMDAGAVPNNHNIDNLKAKKKKTLAPHTPSHSNI